MRGTLLCASCLWLFLAQTVYAKVEATIGPVPISRNVNVGIPLPQSSSREILISRDQYLISYNPVHRSPNWVAWKLESRDIGSVARANTFRKDPDLDQYLARNGEGSAVDVSEYSGSCFDRGHQISSKDRTDNVQDNDETFVMSNMLPQTPYLNRVIWEHLEKYTRDLVQNQNKKIYAFAGPIYDSDFGMIGPNRDIPVPSKNFKILIILDANQTVADINSATPVIAVIMPNVLENGARPIANAANCLPFSSNGSGSAGDWMKYKSTVGEIEKESGLKFQRIGNFINFEESVQQTAISQ